MKIGISEIVTFVTNMVVMVLLLMGPRILAPYMGQYNFVWAGNLCIMLVSLGIGFLVGGRISKRETGHKLISFILFVAGLLIILVPYIKDFILVIALKLGIKWGVGFATVLLFSPATVLLGIITPYSIRLSTSAAEKCGEKSGIFLFFMILGFVFSTFFVTFYLLPSFNITTILFSSGLLLLLFAILESAGILKISASALLLLFVFLYKDTSPFIVNTDSSYNHIIVTDTMDLISGQTFRQLHLANSIQGTISVNSDSIFSTLNKLYVMDDLLKTDIISALSIGGGAFIQPINFLQRHPKSRIKVVEIDRKLTDIARKYLRLKESQQLKVFTQDPRTFLKKTTEKFDAVYCNVFPQSLNIPFHLTTLEFYKQISDHLVDDGLLVVKIFSSFSGKNSQFLKSTYKTLNEIYPQIYLFTTRPQRTENEQIPQTMLLFASKKARHYARRELLQRASPDQMEVVLVHQYDGKVPVDLDTKILTDDFAPLDYYISSF
ncbi:fused MFS/spermidine synthase [candidate division KSB1 bacterium]|nr:fused MFS/spermidine synthase [candidate division KSB1 bacterium]